MFVQKGFCNFFGFFHLLCFQLSSFLSLSPMFSFSKSLCVRINGGRLGYHQSMYYIFQVRNLWRTSFWFSLFFTLSFSLLSSLFLFPKIWRQGHYLSIVHHPTLPSADMLLPPNFIFSNPNNPFSLGSNFFFPWISLKWPKSRFRNKLKSFKTIVFHHFSNLLISNMCFLSLLCCFSLY